MSDDANAPKLDDTERQFYTDILSRINTMIARHHVAEKLLKQYIAKEKIAAEGEIAAAGPREDSERRMWGFKLEALDAILKAVDAIDDDTYSYRQRCAFGRLKLLAAAGPTLPVDAVPVDPGDAAAQRELDQMVIDDLVRVARAAGVVPGEALPASETTKIRDVRQDDSTSSDVLSHMQLTRDIGILPEHHQALDAWIFDSPEVAEILKSVVGQRNTNDLRGSIRNKLLSSYQSVRRDPSPDIDISFRQVQFGILCAYVVPPPGVAEPPSCPDNLAEPNAGDVVRP